MPEEEALRKETAHALRELADKLDAGPITPERIASMRELHGGFGQLIREFEARK